MKTAGGLPFPHARIATARVREGAAEEVRSAWASLLPEYANTGDFGGMVSLHDPDNNVAVTLTLWSSAEAAERAAEALRPLAMAAFGDLLNAPPEILAYDVLLMEVTRDGVDS